MKTLMMLLPIALALVPEAWAQVRGTVSINQRFVDLSGREQKYKELFNLNRGPSVGLELYSDPVQSKNRQFADFYALNVSGVGSDPYSAGQLRMGKTGRWDLRVNYRESSFSWNRDDDAAHPTGMGGLTTNHDWDTERRFGSIHFNGRVTESLRLTLEFNRNTRKGAQFTTRTLDYFGSTAAWAAFQRANPYEVGVFGEPGNVDHAANRLTAGFSYTRNDWNVFFNTGYQSYKETLDLRNAATGQRSINVVEAPTAGELLGSASWKEARKLNSPIAEISYNGSPNPALRLRGSYIFYRYSGPASMDADFAGLARTAAGGTPVAPYTVSVANRSDVREPNHIVDQGFTVRAGGKLNIHTDYRYSRFTIEGNAHFRSIRDNDAPIEGESEHEWQLGLHSLDLALEYIPVKTVVIRPGLRLMKRDVTVKEDGVADPRATERSNIVAPIGSVSFAPSDRLRLRADFQSITNGGPYTRISPRTDRIFRFSGNASLTGRLSLDHNVSVRNGKYSTADFENSFRSSGTTLTFELNDKLAMFGGFVYDSFFATAAVTFLRGTAPLSAVWRDHTINRVWQAGIDAKPAGGLELRLTGNYLRTTGAGEISGEPPTFGPLTWPMVTGTVAWEFPRIGRLALDLQRTYYIEELMQGDNFSANLLSLRWSKDF